MDPRTFQLLEASVQQADDAWRSGNRQEAWDRYRGILRQRLEQVDYNPAALKAADLTVIERWADLSIAFGRGHDADHLLTLTANGYRRIGNHYWFDLITLKRIHLCFGRHAALEARELFRELHPPFNDIESKSATHGFMQSMESLYLHDTEDEPRLVLFQNLYLQLGRLLLYLGKYQAAIGILEHGSEMASAPGGSTPRNAALHFQLELGRAHVERGDLADAEQLLSRIWPTIDRVLQPGHATTWLALSAQLDLLRGDLGSTQARLIEMSKICASNGFELPALRSLLSLTGVYILLNKIHEAERLLLYTKERSEAYDDREMKEEADRLLKVAKARLGLRAGGAESVVQMQGGGKSNATPTSVPSDFPLTTHGRSLQDFESRALQFQFYLSMGKKIAAQTCLERLRSFRQSDSLLIKLRLRALEATFDYYSQDNAKIAAETLHEIMPVFGELGMFPELWRAYVLYEECLRKLQAPADEINSIQKEKNALLDKIQNSLLLDDRIIFLLNKSTSEEEDITRKIRELQGLESAPISAWMQRMRKQYRSQHLLNDLLNLIYRQRHAFAIARLKKGGAPQPWPGIPLWKRLFLRSPNHALISFVVLPDAVLAIAVTWGRLQYKVSKTTRLWLRQRVKEWHETIPESRPDEAAHLASTIARQIGITELLTQLPAGVNRLTILPDDVLHGFPFAAMRFDTNYLIERFTISIGFDAATPSSRRWRRPRVQNALLAGITEGVPRLLKTPEQLGFVEGWLTQRQVQPNTLWNERVTPENLSSFMQNSNLLHISCHGEFSPDNPDNSGWQLLNGKDHEIFGVTRIFGLDLSCLEHATLLSCWGADNYVRPGRWILSLPEALWRAGTGSVVACLWEISEDCAAEFVRHFYNALPGRRTDEAVREAQIRMIKNDSGREREPVDWAGFQFYGTARKLRM